MNKLTYWLRKLGILRTSSYSVKGSADKLNELTASDGEMVQTQKEIDDKYEQEKLKKQKETQ